MAVFKARYLGKCTRCEKQIQPGQYVSWSRRRKPGEPSTIYHNDCANPDRVPTEQEQRSGQGEGQGTGQAGAGEQKAQEQQTTQLAGVNEQRVREIAREEDMTALATFNDALDTKLASHMPVKLDIHIKQAGEERHTKLENAHKMLKPLLYLASKRMHAYLYGPPGSGKSAGAVMAAKALGMRYGYVSLNPQTPESRLLGFIDAGGTYRETEFYRCYVNGGIFCIDELDNGHPALLNTLNGMLESDAEGNGRGAFPCGVVARHADFVCVATGNTNGNGGDMLFPERRALDSAFKERFVFLAWGYDEAVEKAVTLSINKDAGAWLGWVRKVRSYAADNGVRLWASPRASFKGAELLLDSGWKPADIANAVLFKGLDVDTVKRIVTACPLPA